MGKRAWVAIIIAATILCVSPLVYVGWKFVRVFCPRDETNDLSFDRKVWLAKAHCHEDNPRGQMAGDIVKNHLRRGMSVGQVEELLGKPRYDSSKTKYTYDLGGSFRGCPLCYEVLELRLDKQGKLLKAEIVEE